MPTLYTLLEPMPMTAFGQLRHGYLGQLPPQLFVEEPTFIGRIHAGRLLGWGWSLVTRRPEFRYAFKDRVEFSLSLSQERVRS